tara:strand:- start:3423 stop:4385 length:963 start_codon:yes stop_codon:yes gene_type:complete
MYTVKNVKNINQWDDFVDSSKNSNIFFKSFFLEPFKKNILKKFIMKGDEIKAAFLLVLDKDNNITDNEVIIHSGLIFCSSDSEDNSNFNLELYSITEFFVQYIVKNYKKIEFNTVPEFLDVRPFLWYNYGEEKNFFTCYPKYTSFVNIKNCHKKINQSNKPFNKMNTLRRRLIRKGISANTKFINSTDINYFVKSYKDYMIKQKSLPSVQKLNEIKKLLKNLLIKEKLTVKIALTKQNEPGYMCIFADDMKMGYYLYGCPLSEKVENYLGSITFWQAFVELSKKGIDLIDMEGINSPNRGWFKQSFGGKIKQYFEIKLNN